MLDRVSQITPVIVGHDEGLILSNAIKSALSNLEFAETRGKPLVLLDHPSGTTIEVAKSFGKSIRLEVVDNLSLSLTRNCAADYVDTEYVSFLDGDDEWSRNWLRKCAGLLSKNAALHPETNIHVFQLGSLKMELFRSKHVDSSHINFSQVFCLARNPYTALATIPTELLISMGYEKIDLETRYGFEDWEFNLFTMSMGFEHLIVPGTHHIISERFGSMKRRQGYVTRETSLERSIRISTQAPQSSGG